MLPFGNLVIYERPVFELSGRRHRERTHLARTCKQIPRRRDSFAPSHSRAVARMQLRRLMGAVLDVPIGKSSTGHRWVDGRR